MTLNAKRDAAVRKDAIADHKIEQMLRSHRTVPDGRDFKAFSPLHAHKRDDEFVDQYNDTFPGAPGSPEWWAKKFEGKEERKGLDVGYHGERMK